jgi:hypothetical protein
LETAFCEEMMFTCSWAVILCFQPQIPSLAKANVQRYVK